MIIDPTYGTGVRYYQKVCPTLRSHRTGLLVLEVRSKQDSILWTAISDDMIGLRVGKCIVIEDSAAFTSTLLGLDWTGSASDLAGPGRCAGRGKAQGHPDDAPTPGRALATAA